VNTTAAVNVPLTAAPGTGNSRYDLIVARVRDSDAIGGSNNDWIPDVVTGTPASSPSIPSLPASCLLLAIVFVGSNVTVIYNANITDARQVLGQKGWTSGDLKDSASGAAQAGWLVCDGTAYSRTTYANLFAAIGGTFGNGDGSTTFNVPDMRGRVSVGVGSLGLNGAPTVTLGGITANGVTGETVHTLSAGELAPHSHNGGGSVSGTTGGESVPHIHSPGWNVMLDSPGSGWKLPAFTGSWGWSESGNMGDNNVDHNHAFSAGYSFTTDGGNGVAGSAHNNVQPMMGVTRLIKT
jgi:microcystin-dependent protein